METKARFPFLLALGVFVVGVLWAMLRPPESTERIVARNEALVIRELQSFHESEAMYASANGGHFDEPACLITPGECIPGYPPGAPPFQPPGIVDSRRNGYDRTFHAGPRARVDGELEARISTSSLVRYAVVAVPVMPGTSGERAFCIDSRGEMRVSEDGVTPDVTDGRCSAELPVLSHDDVAR